MVCTQVFDTDCVRYVCQTGLRNASYIYFYNLLLKITDIEPNLASTSQDTSRRHEMGTCAARGTCIRSLLRRGQFHRSVLRAGKGRDEFVQLGSGADLVISVGGRLADLSCPSSIACNFDRRRCFGVEDAANRSLFGRRYRNSVSGKMEDETPSIPRFGCRKAHSANCLGVARRCTSLCHSCYVVLVGWNRGCGVDWCGPRDCSHLPFVVLSLI